MDLTTSDVEGLGFKVVKVLIPGMQPIDWPVAALGGPRLYEVPLGSGTGLSPPTRTESLSPSFSMRGV